jgi:capsular polysaccharide biosynthesis protein
MAHPLSIELLRALAHKVAGDVCGYKLVYISRADAERRRLANEGEIVCGLSRLGFVSVELSKLSTRQQIGLFRDAEVIVAPHGMGLTHVAFAQRLKGVVEIFPPNAGTDAYAFILKAMGVNYSFVIGTSADNNFGDFRANSAEIMRCVDELLA